MPTLRCSYVISLDRSDRAPVQPASDAKTHISLSELSDVVLPTKQDELFGPHAQAFLRFKAKRAWLLTVSRDVRGGAGSFFVDARQALLESTQGLTGFVLDALRLWPFAIADAAEALSDEPLAEDLFSVGFTEMGEHGFRAETVGLAKLDQREISFEFKGKELLEDAALMCGHLADWAMEHGHRVQHGQSMAYGFDKLTFVAPGDQGSLRTWHAPLIQKLLPESVFPGVGVLEVKSVDGEGKPQPLTVPLARALEQRLVLEEHDLTGDAPFQSTTAKVSGVIADLKGITAVRQEPTASKDSGWRLTSTVKHTEGPNDRLVTLAELVAQKGELLRYLALPPGVRLHWDAQGRLSVDTSKVQGELDDDESDDDLE